MQYDKFPAFQSFQASHTFFKASRYETWQNQKMVDGGACETVIEFMPGHKPNGQPTTLFRVINNGVRSADINTDFDLDTNFSQNDRLTLATIPQVERGESLGIVGVRNMIGITDPAAVIKGNVPYCGNMFNKLGILVKMSFSFSQPDKLVELFSGEKEDMLINALVAKAITEILIKTFDERGGIIDFDEVSQDVLVRNGFNTRLEHFEQAANILNSGALGYKDIIRVSSDPTSNESFIIAKCDEETLLSVWKSISEELNS